MSELDQAEEKLRFKHLEHAKLPDDFIGTIVRKRNNIRPLLPQGFMYNQQLNCKSCGKNTYDSDRLLGGSSNRQPSDESMCCDWCDYRTHDFRFMGLHVSQYHKEHPKFMDEWLKIHEDGIDFEWREENIPKDDDKSRSPAPIELVYRFGNKIP